VLVVQRVHVRSAVGAQLAAVPIIKNPGRPAWSVKKNCLVDPFS
jgi:hypothetical protein